MSNLNPRVPDRTTEWRFTVLAAGYTAGILILSSVPGDSQQPSLQFIRWVRPEVQNLLHLPLFAGLSLTWCLALSEHMIHSVRILMVALVIAIVVGAVDEWHQAFVPGRFASLTDGVLNVLGATAGVFIWRQARRLRQR